MDITREEFDDLKEKVDHIHAFVTAAMAAFENFQASGMLQMLMPMLGNGVPQNAPANPLMAALTTPVRNHG